MEPANAAISAKPAWRQHLQDTADVAAASPHRGACGQTSGRAAESLAEARTYGKRVWR